MLALFCIYSTSSTAGGRVVNVTSGNVKYTISGIAPGAWMMNYRFVGGGGNVFSVFDEVVEDASDISSNSWGYDPFYNSAYSTHKLFVNNSPIETELCLGMTCALFIGCCHWEWHDCCGGSRKLWPGSVFCERSLQGLDCCRCCHEDVSYDLCGPERQAEHGQEPAVHPVQRKNPKAVLCDKVR